MSESCAIQVMTASIQLADTSAFVILLTKDGIHTSQNSRKYMSMLDLSSGKKLYQECMRVWPHLDELVLNRKSAILQEAKSRIQDNHIEQVAIFGSGMDALSLEIISENDFVKVYEIDAHQMEHKQVLIDRVTHNTGRITCVTADLNRPDEVMTGIGNAGWDKSKPSILVLEGISYYLKPEALLDIIERFSENAVNHIIVEYIVPGHMIDKERAHIPDTVFGIIQQTVSGGLKIERLTYDNIRQLAKAVGGTDSRRHTMHGIEKRRTGKNRFFPTESSGWVEVVCFKTTPKT